MKQDDKRKLENQLMVMGLKRLEDPELIPQMAALIKDHTFYLGLLNECDQQKRREMYDALKPYLRFKPWPLDRYINLLKQHASNIASRETPITVGEKKFQEVTQAEATQVVATVKCCKCTRTATFEGETPADAVIQARKAGWVRDLERQKEICPKCPAIREMLQYA